jgi:hypothetical protein
MFGRPGQYSGGMPMPRQLYKISCTTEEKRLREIRWIASQRENLTVYERGLIEK